jgi:hypothetical protein
MVTMQHTVILVHESYVYMSTAIMIKKLVETSVFAYTAAVSYILARDVG